MGVASMDIASMVVASMEVASSGSLIYWRADRCPMSQRVLIGLTNKRSNRVYTMS